MRSDKVFMARTTRFHEFARSLTTTLGVEVSLATPDSPTAAHDFDLLILDSDGIRSDRIDQIAKWLDDRGGVPMLVIVGDEAHGTLRPPNHAHADFVCPTASPLISPWGAWAQALAACSRLARRTLFFMVLAPLARTLGGGAKPVQCICRLIHN